jgi:hypothetical protein
MTKKEIKQPQFKIIEDSKDEPNLKEAQKFVGGYVQGRRSKTLGVITFDPWR